MAGLKGNVAWLAAAKQSARGTAATVALPAAAVPGTYKVPFAGGSIAPVRQTDNLSETDSSRDRGTSYVVTSGVEGEPSFYVRDANIGFWLQAGLGADAVTGTTPNFIHTLTPSNSLPYITAWRNIADTLWEQYLDCKVNSLGISAQAGQPLMCSAGIQGRQSTRLTTDPTTTAAIPIANGAVYNYNDAAVTLGGGATALVSSFDLSITNAVTRQQTDDVVPYDVVEGIREVSLGFDLIFEDLVEYNKFHYGSSSGTVISPNIFTTSATFTFTKSVNNEISFTFPSIAYEEFPVEPNAGGDPITVSVRAIAQRGASPVVTAVVKNQVAIY